MITIQGERPLQQKRKQFRKPYQQLFDDLFVLAVNGVDQKRPALEVLFVVELLELLRRHSVFDFLEDEVLVASAEEEAVDQALLGRERAIDDDDDLLRAVLTGVGKHRDFVMIL